MSETNPEVILISGATGGLGPAVSRAFLDQGATVIGVARRISSQEHPHSTFVPYPADLTAASSLPALLDDLRAYWPRLTAVVHLMGGFAAEGPIPETSVETWDHMMNLNARSAFLLFRSFVPLLRHNGGGALLAIGSRAVEDAPAGVGAYSASKAALVSLVRTLARENNDVPISANVLLPGAIDTPANRRAMPGADFSRWTRPDSLAKLIVYLASPAGRQVTGAVIPVYGSGL